jgi:hypothetical protein
VHAAPAVTVVARGEVGNESTRPNRGKREPDDTHLACLAHTVCSLSSSQAPPICCPSTVASALGAVFQFTFET